MEGPSTEQVVGRDRRLLTALFRPALCGSAAWGAIIAGVLLTSELATSSLHGALERSCFWVVALAPAVVALAPILTWSSSWRRRMEWSSRCSMVLLGASFATVFMDVPLLSSILAWSFLYLPSGVLLGAAALVSRRRAQREVSRADPVASRP